MPSIIIIGSGPAGISAALYAVRAGVDTTVLTKGPGALDRAEKIENYYGFAEPVSGAELERHSIENAKRLGVRFVTAEAVGLTYTDKLTVETVDKNYPADAVILATGASRAVPRIPGLAGLEGHGVSYCAACDAFFYRGKDVAVLMFCRHCLRYSMGWCPRYGGEKSPFREPYYLVSSDGRRFRLSFDCKACQMKVYADAEE